MKKERLISLPPLADWDDTCYSYTNIEDWKNHAITE